jgi:hypothetical protein
MAGVDQALCKLTANLMRVTRGSGKPYEIIKDVNAFIAALVAYRNETSELPWPDDLANALISRNDLNPVGDAVGSNSGRTCAEQIIIDAALQMVASRLLGQKPQEAIGHRDMYEGYRQLKVAEDEEAKRWAEPRPTRTKVERKQAIKALLVKHSRSGSDS